VKTRPRKAGSKITIDDLVGVPLPAPRFKDEDGKSDHKTGAPSSSASSAGPDDPQEPAFEQPVSDADIASFKALNVEVSLSSRTLGPVKIVPGTADSTANELSAEQAAYLLNLAKAWPGAVIEEIRWPTRTRSTEMPNNGIVANPSNL
jgi:hypothetical protein